MWFCSWTYLALQFAYAVRPTPIPIKQGSTAKPSTTAAFAIWPTRPSSLTYLSSWRVTQNLPLHSCRQTSCFSLSCLLNYIRMLWRRIRISKGKNLPLSWPLYSKSGYIPKPSPRSMVRIHRYFSLLSRPTDAAPLYSACRPEMRQAPYNFNLTAGPLVATVPDLKTAIDYESARPL